MNPSSSSSQSEPQVHNSSNSSTSRSRSSSTDRQVVRTTTKNQQERLNRKSQRERFIREKEFIFKRQSTSIFEIETTSSHCPNSKESKEEKIPTFCMTNTLMKICFKTLATLIIERLL